MLCDLMWAHSLNCLLSVSRHRPNGHPSDLPSTPEYPNAYSSSSLGCVLSGISHTACPEQARFPGVVPLRPNLPPQPLAPPFTYALRPENLFSSVIPLFPSAHIQSTNTVSSIFREYPKKRRSHPPLPAKPAALPSLHSACISLLDGFPSFSLHRPQLDSC